MMSNSSFNPAWWLRNPHLQTLWPKLFRPYPKVATRRERLELPDGDFLDLNFTLTESGPMVMVLHGLEGSLESKYAAGILKALQHNGYRAVLMHFRNCSGEPNRLARSYHSGETEDIRFVLRYLQQHYPAPHYCAIGYSLGGNALLKLLGEHPNAISLTAAVAVSVPFFLDKVADRLRHGFSKIYQRYLLHSLLRNTQRKSSQLSKQGIDLNRLPALTDFWDFDEYITAPLHGFKNAQDYYQRCSSRQFLRTIAIPTLILHAADDPFMTPDVIPTADELSAKITFELSQHGGHVGFIQGNIPGMAHYWLEARIPAYLNSVLATV